jgi:hypothetical protein
MLVGCCRELATDKYGALLRHIQPRIWHGAVDFALHVPHSTSCPHVNVNELLLSQRFPQDQHRICS